MKEPELRVVGRIIEASVQELTAECLAPGEAPELGALVATVDGEPAVYAAVASVETAGIDPARPITPHGGAGDDLETVLTRNPHLQLLLRTSFRAVTLAHAGPGGIRNDLPDSPPRLFARVRLCGNAELSAFVDLPDFVDSLLRAGESDDVIAALIQRAGRLRADPTAFLLEIGRRLVPPLAGEPERLTAILRRISPQRSRT